MLIFPWTFYDHDFNPRSREGSDDYLQQYSAAIRDFNPRSREGSDLKRQGDRLGHSEFQSTLPRGERPDAAHSGLRIITHFNPRSREGSDKTSVDRFLSPI